MTMTQNEIFDQTSIDTFASRTKSRLQALVRMIKRNDMQFSDLKPNFPHLHYFTKYKPNKDINCHEMFMNNMTEIENSKNLSTHKKRMDISAKQYAELASNCSEFKESRGYILEPLSKLEENFSIAYSILMFKDVEQTERLFRAIYRPQHVFCIHVDIKANEDVMYAMQNITACFENVFLSSRRVSVQWGTFSVLEADLICAEDLWNRTKTWRYFINLTGQEFPLRTNFELVQILTAFNGANDVSGTRKRANKGRWRSAGKPPHNTIPAKGSVHVALSRAFVDFMLHDRRSLDILEWAKKVGIPDEAYFTMLNHNPHLHAPGSYAGEAESTSNETKPFVVRFKNWGDSIYDWPCHGQRVRMVCVFGSGDLPLLSQRREMFANKFYLDYQHSLDCIEELVFNRTRDQYLGKSTFNATWYGQLGFVKNKL